MITEDYISFETSKLLRDKEFDEECQLYYGDYKYPCPTLQMAMKWLRKIHHIDIEVRTHYLNRLKPNDVRYYTGKILKGSEDVIYTIYSKDTYEEVCDAAIRYCLENLI